MTRPQDINHALKRDFAVLLLEWDGTALADLRAQPGTLRGRLERLTALGVDIAVVSDEVLGDVDEQLCARPDVEGRLFLFLSRGSEVYVVGPTGPRLLQRRQAADEEETQLDEAAGLLRDKLASGGMKADVAVRLNRRVIDLMPQASDPSRAGAVTMRQHVETTLERAGVHGLVEAVELARLYAGEAGLTHARVGSDIKHIVIGLTDKGDAARQALRALVSDRGREPEDVLVIGDELGPPGGVDGGDGLTFVPELGRAVVVSVGREAAGGPLQVVSVGGGPDGLLAILDDQIKRREKVALRQFPVPTDDPAWRFEVKGFDPFREREVETWLTVANGESGTRGALEEGSAVSTPATFVAGVYGDGTDDPPFRQPVPAPDWTGLRLKVDGRLINLSTGELLDHERVLDMSDGVVYRFWRQREAEGRTLTVRTARFASLADRQVMATRAEATPEDFSGRISWEGAVGVTHAGGPTRETVFERLDGAGFVASTKGRNGGGHALALTTRAAPGSPVARHMEHARDVIGGRLAPGDPATVDRLAGLVASRLRVPPADAARRVLARAEELGFDELLARHRAAWAERWRDADLRIDGDPSDQQALRFSIYHMISTAHPTKDTVSVGARGLGGMSYFLHVFWDTEIFVLPFFIYTHPQTARTLLTYRFRNLDGARQKARHMGHRGALYPWESADKGVETTPPYGYGPDGEMVPILSGLMEHHISGDVAWGVWEYWKATGDDAWMASMGVEVMLETARFWASRAARGEDDRYHIRMVVGPDEYHEGVDDNAYTNVLARWNIGKAVEALAWLERVDSAHAAELREKLELTDAEISDWLEVAYELIDGYDPKTKLFEQFAGFYEMDAVPIEKLRPRPMPADLLLTREVTLRSKVVKQADVVMLTHILSDEFDDEVARANYDYYEPITCHGSSLSPGIHAAVAARLGDVTTAVEDFKMAAAIDLADNMGNAARGLHMATMGGLWQAAVLGFAGLQRRHEALLIDPHLPPDWKRVQVPLWFRGARADFDLHRTKHADHVGITVERAALTVLLDGEERSLPPGKHLLRRSDGGPWEVVVP